MATRRWEGANKVAAVGVGYSKLGRMLERPTGALAVDACRAAIADAGLSIQDIDGLATSGGNEEPGLASASVVWMVGGLGVEQVNWHAHGDTQSAAIGHAINALANNLCDYVLVWGAARQPRRGGVFGAGHSSAAEGMTIEDQLSLPYGFGDGELAWNAPTYQRYMQLYGAKREHLATYAVTARENANKNPHAYFYSHVLTREDYLGSRMVADPLCLFDCDMPIDGAVAMVLARSDRARDLKQPPAYVTAYGTSGWDWRHMIPKFSTEFMIDDSAGNVGRTLWASTDMTQKDMSGVMFFDGFAPNVYYLLEGMGFCKRGEAFEYIQGGRIAIDGELPLNTHGGHLSEGRLGGMGHWAEAITQVQGRADDKLGDRARQIADVQNILLVPSLGVYGKPTGVVLSKDPC